MITEKSNRLLVIMITDYDYPNSDARTHLTRISNISFVITMLCALTGQCTHHNVYNLNMSMTFLDRGFNA